MSPLSHVYGAFWQIGNGHSSTLVLRNDAPRGAATVQVTLFGNLGQKAGVAQIQIAANSVNRVDLSTIVGAQGGWGGVVMEYLGAVLQIAGKVVVADSQSGTSVELPMQGGYRYDTENALYAPWWLPDRVTEGRITLFNSSGQSLVVSPSVAVKGVEQLGSKLTLDPYETKQLRLRDLLGESNEIAGAVIVRYSGPPHALQPALLMENRSTGFSLASTFNARHTQSTSQATTWQFPDVLLGSMVLSTQESVQVGTYALLTNGTASVLNTQLTAYYGIKGRAAKIAIPVAALAPLETRLIDLSQIVSDGLIPASVSHIGLSATHNGVPGDLGIEVFNVSQTNSFVLKSAGVVLPAGVVDSSYWNTDTNVCLLPKAQNVSSATANGQAAAYYQTSFGAGSYELPVMSVPAGKSKALPLKQDLQSGIPDQNGAVVPAGTTSGILTLAVVSGIHSSTDALAVPVTADCETAETCSIPLVGSPVVGADVTSPTLQLVVPETCPPPDAPVISSISPTGAPFGTDTTVTLTGENFDDSGLTIHLTDSTGSITATNMTVISSTELKFQLNAGDNTANVNSQDLYLASDYGYSNKENFQIGDPTPSISGVTPVGWPAGQNTAVTITGTGFGSEKGTVTISDSRLIWTTGTWTDTGASGGAQITGTVSVPASIPLEYPTVTVTSKGYSSSGFTQSTPGQTPTSPTYQVTVNPGSQKPTSLKVLSASIVPLTSIAKCLLTYYGIAGAIHYQVLDQNKQPIQSDGLVPQEEILNVVFNGSLPYSPFPDWVNIGPNNGMSTKYTDASGTFWDDPYGACATSSFVETSQQPISILVSGINYTVRTNNWTITAPTVGHGSLSNGSDVKLSY
jgi:hypothetical protein